MRVLGRIVAWLIMLASITFIVGRLLFFEFPEIQTEAMAPSVIPGDTLVVSKRRVPTRGELALFEPPNVPGGVQVRRVLAVPGDTIEIVRGAVTVNDSLVKAALPGKGFAKKRIDGYFVVADAPGQQDSRHFGTVQAAAVRGTATHILIPSKARQKSRLLEPIK